MIAVSEVGAGMAGFADSLVAETVAQLQGADLVIAASPTLKGTYTGLATVFLDQRAPGAGLAGRVSIPWRLGVGTVHALAPEPTPKLVHVKLGAVCPGQGFDQLDSHHADTGARDTWLAARGTVALRFTREDWSR